MNPGRADLDGSNGQDAMPLPKGAQWIVQVSWLAADYTPPVGYSMELGVYPSDESTTAVFTLASAIAGTTTLSGVFTAPNATSALVALRNHRYRVSFVKSGADTLAFIYGTLPTMAWGA